MRKPSLANSAGKVRDDESGENHGPDFLIVQLTAKETTEACRPTANRIVVRASWFIQLRLEKRHLRDQSDHRGSIGLILRLKKIDDICAAVVNRGRGV